MELKAPPKVSVMFHGYSFKGNKSQADSHYWAGTRCIFQESPMCA